MARFTQDSQAQKALSETRKLSDMKSEDFATIFYVGGHGPLKRGGEVAGAIGVSGGMTDQDQATAEDEAKAF
ncbi:heme-binding protein [Paludibaculum fermentans]|uniref:Heme-binding protein n=1 Tax=Paludibaculum fermentans TaxID=1473598 RepID=A0A7S7NY14_PALFE|nr:heme-binding protein [Paludibaculum fermentans]QOY91888.1 heme-binding protein [Paludibaculum fermentans]